MAKASKKAEKPVAPGKRGRGRPEIPLTPEKAKAIVNALASGLPREHAAQLAGISVRTMMRWRAKGRDAARGLYHDFCRDMKKAESYFVGQQLKAIVEIGRGEYESEAAPQWTALAWVLERRFPGDFGRRDTTAHTVEGKGKKAMQLVLVEGPAKIDPPDEMP
ncbi:MAG TPA: hypothetical protein VGE74_13170 [Gemmata sp.]